MTFWTIELISKGEKPNLKKDKQYKQNLCVKKTLNLFIKVFIYIESLGIERYLFSNLPFHIQVFTKHVISPVLIKILGPIKIQGSMPQIE